MLSEDGDAEGKIKNILKEFADHSTSLSHNRHISAEKAASLGLNITMMEDDQELQDIILSLHHVNAITAQRSSVIKFIVNQDNVGQFLNVKETVK